VSKTNILKVFINIVNNYQTEIENISSGNNRANNMGKGLEEYIQNAFANTLNESDEIKKLEKYQEIFSYQGNKNNPPDLILKSSDAIEIKKIESKNSAIALNSSYPKDKLYSNSTMITKVCKECEEWSEKNMLYAIGYTPKSTKKLNSLWLIYGDCFCANKESYEKIKNTISNGITSIQGVEFTPTNELGKVKKIDPLGITDLRIRGMWHIENPNRVFNYIYQYDETKDFQLIAVMPKEKYNSMPQSDKNVIESFEKIEIKDIKIKNPNNPVKLIDGKMLVFRV
jgi:hypothetical protein